MVVGFADALGAKDVAKARTFLLGPADCDTVAKGAKARAACKKDVATASDALAKIEIVPPGTRASRVRHAGGDGLAGGKLGEDAFELLVAPEGAACTVEYPVFAVRVGGGYRVVLPMRKAEQEP